MTSKINEKMFICQICDYKTDRKFNYEKHLKSSKHLMLQKTTSNNLENYKYKCECGSVYKYSSGLRRHKMTCQYYLKLKDNSSLSNSKSELEQIMIEQMSCIKEQQQQISELIPKVGNNNNNQLNINVFLNEICKDAVCI